jgi:hypothetical protein
VDLGTTTTVAGDDGRYVPIVSSGVFAFDARSGDTASASFAAVHVRYIQLTFTANSGWPAAQLSELGVFS